MQTNKTLKWMACCAVLVGSFEGLALTAYPDKLAGGLPTACYGETEGVILGTTYTKAQCTEMLANKLPRYWAEIERCIKVGTTDNEKIAYTSFAYNVGSAAFCKSTTARLLNSGDHVGACERLAMYNRTKSKGVVTGLTNRRSKETAICLAMKPVGPVAPKVLPAAQPRLSAPIAPHVPVCHGWWFWKVCK